MLFILYNNMRIHSNKTAIIIFQLLNHLSHTNTQTSRTVMGILLKSIAKHPVFTSDTTVWVLHAVKFIRSDCQVYQKRLMNYFLVFFKGEFRGSHPPISMLYLFCFIQTEERPQQKKFLGGDVTPIHVRESHMTKSQLSYGLRPTFFQVTFSRNARSQWVFFSEGTQFARTINAVTKITRFVGTLHHRKTPVCRPTGTMSYVNRGKPAQADTLPPGSELSTFLLRLNLLRKILSPATNNTEVLTF